MENDPLKAAIETFAETAPPTIQEVSYDDFLKLDIRVGVIKLAEKIPKKDRLMKLEVDLGVLGMRTIVAGIAEHYVPEELVGSATNPRTILVVTNLAPRKVGGVMSHGMLLAGKDIKSFSTPNLSLASCDGMIPGTEIG